MEKTEKIIKIIFIIILYIIAILLISLLVKNIYMDKDNKNNTDTVNEDNTNKTSAIETSKNYFEISDIQSINQNIASGKKDDLIYHTYFDNENNEQIIAIFEQNNITERTYSSLLSFIYILKGEEEVELFKQNVKNVESLIYGDYELIVNPVLSETVKNYYQELNIDDTYNITQLKIKMNNNILDNIKLYEGINKSPELVEEMIRKNMNNITSYSGRANENYLELILSETGYFIPDVNEQEEYINNIINTFIDKTINYNISLVEENNNLKVIIEGIKI